MAPPVHGIALVYLYVTDIPRALPFYGEAFDLTFIAHGDDRAECTASDGARLAFHLTTGARRATQKPGTAIVDPLTNDLEAVRQRLAWVGAAVGEIGEAPAGRFFEFTDPEGDRVQVLQPIL